MTDMLKVVGAGVFLLALATSCAAYRGPLMALMFSMAFTCQ